MAKFARDTYVKHEGTGRVGRVVESNDDKTVVRYNGSSGTASVTNSQLSRMDSMEGTMSRLDGLVSRMDALEARHDATPSQEALAKRLYDAGIPLNEVHHRARIVTGSTKSANEVVEAYKRISGK